MSKAIEDVAAERARQVTAEGRSEQHDDMQAPRCLAIAAACYVQHYVGRAWVLDGEPANLQRYRDEEVPDDWPADWEDDSWKPKDPRRDLVRAAALIVAEIERLDRAGAA